MSVDPVETVLAGRFEWERCLRRVPMKLELKGFAFILASWADPDGTRVRPGVTVLCAVTGKSDSTVRRYLKQLRAMGLLTVVSRGGGRNGAGKAADFRLSVPADLLAMPGLLGPNDEPAPAADSPVIQVTAQSVVSEVEPAPSPVDNSPVEELHAADPEPSEDRLTGHPRRLTGHPGDRLPTTYTNHTFQPPAIPDRPGHSLAPATCGQTNRSPPVAVPAA